MGKMTNMSSTESLGIALLISFCYGAQQQVLSLDYLSANTSLKKGVKIIIDDRKNLIRIYIKVMMGNNVSDAFHLFPLNRRI